MNQPNFNRATDKELERLVAHYYEHLKPIRHAEKLKTSAIVSIFYAVLASLFIWFWILKFAGVL